nr:thiol:disulfide interchange protein DsbA/DsbL [Allopusillimonas soli]
MKRFLLRSLAAVVFASGTLLTSAAQAADPYVTLDVAQPSDTAGKIEVLEFFAYSCPHCAHMEPMVEKMLPSLPDNVVFRGVPVAFNASMADLQRLYYSLQALDRMDLHSKVFDAIHKDHDRIYTADAITDWIVKQGVDRKAFEDVFNSFGINTKLQRANELAEAYKIEGTPSFAVAGKYVTSPSMTGSYEGTIEEVEKLVAKATGQ